MTELAVVLIGLALLVVGLCLCDLLAAGWLRMVAHWHDWNAVQDEKERLRALRPSPPRVMRP
jgi:hypothetical protein